MIIIYTRKYIFIMVRIRKCGYFESKANKVNYLAYYYIHNHINIFFSHEEYPSRRQAKWNVGAIRKRMRGLNEMKRGQTMLKRIICDRQGSVDDFIN